MIPKLAWATSVWGKKAHIVLRDKVRAAFYPVHTFCGREADLCWNFRTTNGKKPHCRVCTGVADKAGYL